MGKGRNLATQRYKDNFASRLRVMIAARNMSRVELSRRTGITETSVNDYCNGRTLPNAYFVAKICTALNADANELLGVRR